MSENPYYPYSSYEAWRAVAGLPVVILDDKQAMIWPFSIYALVYGYAPWGAAGAEME